MTYNQLIERLKQEDLLKGELNLLSKGRDDLLGRFLHLKNDYDIEMKEYYYDTIINLFLSNHIVNQYERLLIEIQILKFLIKKEYQKLQEIINCIELQC